MQIQQDTVQGAIVVAPAGRIDSTTADALDAHLLRLAFPALPRLVIDFSAVDYISSAGLRVMLSLAKRMREKKGRLTLCGLGDGVRQVFELAGFLPLFAIEGTRDQAVETVARP